MFGRFFPRRFFPRAYFPQGGDLVPVPPPLDVFTGERGRRSRHLEHHVLVAGCADIRVIGHVARFRLARHLVAAGLDLLANGLEANLLRFGRLVAGAASITSATKRHDLRVGRHLGGAPAALVARVARASITYADVAPIAPVANVDACDVAWVELQRCAQQDEDDALVLLGLLDV